LFQYRTNGEPIPFNSLCTIRDSVRDSCDLVKRRMTDPLKNSLTLNVALDSQQFDAGGHRTRQVWEKLDAILGAREGRFRGDSFLRRAGHGALLCRVRHSKEQSLGGSELLFNGPRRAVRTICFRPCPPRPGQRDGSARWLLERTGTGYLAVARVPSRERDRPSIQEMRLVWSPGCVLILPRHFERSVICFPSSGSWLS
jgi:hypothetical protein